MNTALFKEELIDHYKFPRNKKALKKPDFCVYDRNPSCGDAVSIEGKITNNVIDEIGFSGKGCILSQATTSMLIEKCVGKSCDVIKNLSKEDILKLIGLSVGPNRLRCAMLSLEVLKRGLQEVSKQV